MESLDPKGRSEQDLLLRLKNGDNHAWSYLTQEYSPRLYNFLLQKLPSSDDAQDIVGDTMVAAVRAISTFDGKVTLSTFLFSLANHKLVDFWRRHQKTAELSDTFVDLASNTDGVEFREIFNSLSEQHRDILLWRYQTGLGVDEIADLLGKTYKATESLLSRAKQELKKALDKNKDDE